MIQYEHLEVVAFKAKNIFLADTGSMSCEDLCRKAGFDITKKDFWQTGIEMYVKEIDEFCKLCEG